MFEERVDNWADDRDTGVGYNPAFLKRVREKREAEEREIRKAEALRRRDAERSALEFARFLRMAPRAELRFRKLMTELSARNRENKIAARPVSVKDIIEMTEIKYDLPKGSICGPSRNHRIVKARFEAIAAARAARPDLSTPALGRLFGGRDHTSILHALNKVRTAQAA